MQPYSDSAEGLYFLDAATFLLVLLLGVEEFKDFIRSPSTYFVQFWKFLDSGLIMTLIIIAALWFEVVLE
jgi:hypothetical protein